MTHQESDPPGGSTPSEDSRRSGSLGSAVGASFVVSGCIAMLNVVTGVVLARQLGPTGRGELAAALIWPSLMAALGSVGLPQATTYYAARGTAPGVLASSSLVIGSILSVVLVGLGLLILPLALGGHEEVVLDSSYLYLLYIPLSLFTLPIMGILNGVHRYLWFQTLRLFVYAATAALLVGLAAEGSLDVRSAVIAYLVATSANLALAVLLLSRVNLTPLTPSVAVSRQLVAFGLKSHLSYVSSLLNERLDQLVISVVLSAERLGLYVVAVTLTQLTTLVGQSMAVVALPALARMKTPEAQARGARFFVGFTLVLASAASLVIMALVPQLINLFFGADFLPAVAACRILLVATVIFSTNRTLEALLQALGRPLDAGTGEALALGATAVSLAILLPLFGLVGAAGASLIAYAVSALYLGRRAMSVLNVPANDLFLPTRRMLSLAELRDQIRGMDA